MQVGDDTLTAWDNVKARGTVTNSDERPLRVTIDAKFMRKGDYGTEQASVHDDTTVTVAPGATETWYVALALGNPDQDNPNFWSGTQDFDNLSCEGSATAEYAD